MFIIGGDWPLTNVYVFWRDVHNFFGISLFHLTFLRYHRENCCNYHVLNEVLIREYDLKNYSGPWAEYLNQRAISNLRFYGI